jgi:hypothetical protein
MPSSKNWATFSHCWDENAKRVRPQWVVGRPGILQRVDLGLRERLGKQRIVEPVRPRAVNLVTTPSSVFASLQDGVVVLHQRRAQLLFDVQRGHRLADCGAPVFQLPRACRLVA